MDQYRSPRRFAAKTRQRMILGGLAATSLSLGGCSSSPPQFQDAEFTSVAACTSAGFPDSVCQAGYNAAFIQHERATPKFTSVANCEKEWGTGQCAPASPPAASTGSSVGSFFAPALAGFIVSQALQRRYYDNDDIGVGYYGGYGSYRGSPIYRNRSGSNVALDATSGKAIARPVNVNTRTVSARGFGGSGLSRGGGGWGG